MSTINWHWAKFCELTSEEQYELHQVRQSVFILGQGIAYLDADGKDIKAYHLLGWEGKKLVAYLRVVPQPPGVKIGRVLTLESHRNKGVGKKLVKVALEKIEVTYGEVPIEMSAQTYLEGFYQSLGFLAVGSPFNLEGLPHIHMVKDPN